MPLEISMAKLSAALVETESMQHMKTGVNMVLSAALNLIGREML